MEAPPIRLAGRVDVGGVDATRFAAPGFEQHLKRSPVLRYQPGTPVGPWGQTVLFEPGAAQPRARLNSFRAQQGRAVAPTPDRHERALFDARSSRGESAWQKASAKAAERIAHGIGSKKRDPLGGTSRFTIPRDLPSIGRTLTVRQRLHRLDSLEDGLLLRLQLPADRFVEGPNTIAVAVIPGRGPRLEQSVSFAVFRGQPAKRPKIPAIKDPTYEVPIPGGLRGFEPGKKKPAPADGRPAKSDLTWTPLKKDRIEAARSAAARQSAKSKKTAAAISKRLETVKARVVVGAPQSNPGRTTIKKPRLTKVKDDARPR